MVRQYAHVLHDLVGEVAASLQQRDAVQDGVSARLGAREQHAQPAVQREAAQEAECGATF